MANLVGTAASADCSRTASRSHWSPEQSKSMEAGSATASVIQVKAIDLTCGRRHSYLPRYVGISRTADDSRHVWSGRVQLIRSRGLDGRHATRPDVRDGSLGS